jgi:hypothetical protein
MSQQFNVIVSDTLGSGILLKILKDCDLNREDLQDLL